MGVALPLSPKCYSPGGPGFVEVAGKAEGDVRRWVAGNYRAPEGVEEGEKFTVKIQLAFDNSGPLVWGKLEETGVELRGQMLVYSEDLSCGFVLSEGEEGFAEIKAAVPERAVKVYVKMACEGGRMTAFPNLRTVKSW
jgi:hypothetical protein